MSRVHETSKLGSTFISDAALWWLLPAPSPCQAHWSAGALNRVQYYFVFKFVFELQLCEIGRYSAAVPTSQYLKVFDVVWQPGSQCPQAHEVWLLVYSAMPRSVQPSQLCRSFVNRGESFIFATNQKLNPLPHEAFKLTQKRHPRCLQASTLSHQSLYIFAPKFW